jgi:hypothetical protein
VYFVQLAVPLKNVEAGVRRRTSLAEGCLSIPVAFIFIVSGGCIERNYINSPTRADSTLSGKLYQLKSEPHSYYFETRYVEQVRLAASPSTSRSGMSLTCYIVVYRHFCSQVQVELRFVLGRLVHLLHREGHRGCLPTVRGNREHSYSEKQGDSPRPLVRIHRVFMRNRGCNSHERNERFCFEGAAVEVRNCLQASLSRLLNCVLCMI